MTDGFICTVYGHPEPAGSKTSGAIYRKGPDGTPQPVMKNGRVVTTTRDANKGAAAWKSHVQQWAGTQMAERELLEGPLALVLAFYVKRPKGHWGTGRNEGTLKASAPSHPTVKPDVLKLARGVEDALSGIVYRDDSQIVHETLSKVYDTPERVYIEVVPLQDALEGADAEEATHSSD